MLKKAVIFIMIILIAISIPFILTSVNSESSNEEKLNLTNVVINVKPYSIIYEGDVISCDITDNVDFMYWSINNISEHYSFYDDDPVIFNPESTPLEDTYVNLTVFAENSEGNNSVTIPIMLKKIFFGDIHWHTTFCDGEFSIDEMYSNAIADNYLDFACTSPHGELVKIKKLFGWKRLKDITEQYYIPGEFSNFLGYEYTGWKLSTASGIKLWPLKERSSHINFYYKEVYDDANSYSRYRKKSYKKIVQTMAEHRNNGELNIGYFHHPLGQIKFLSGLITVDYYSNWSLIFSKLENKNFCDNFLSVIRGVEVYSQWGTSIGKYSGLPVHFSDPRGRIYEHSDCWVENALWEWSNNDITKNGKFVFIASSDIHHVNRPGGAISYNSFDGSNPSGIMAAYAVHNTREEIWDAMDACDTYGTQLLKIRANVRFDEQMALGRWIDCSSPLKINISVMSTFQGNDGSGKSMCPYVYPDNALDNPISDVWIIKKDKDRGRPWCKIIKHWQLDDDIVTLSFEDSDVQPNDFYYIAIRQKGAELRSGENNYTAFLGPVFINNVKNS